MSEKITGAQSLVKALEQTGVDVMFGIPGGAILPAYDPIFDSKIRHILVRHEQGAGHAATGYAQVTGKVGVCIATSGPGATNLVTPLADAQMDSVPIVAITGQVPGPAIGTDAFQEADIRGVTMPITKHNYLITNPDEIPTAIAEAFYIARTGRPGPVLVDIAKDALQMKTDFKYPSNLKLAGYNPVVNPDLKMVQQAAQLICESKKPVLYIGGGIIKANASAELMQLAELINAPVVTTLMARGAFPDSHRLHLGMPGMHGTVAAVTALQKADLLITLGARFDDRVTGKLSSFATKAKVIHADIDPAEIGKNRHADVPLIGDLKNILKALIPTVNSELAKNKPDLTSWWQEVDSWRNRFPLGFDEPADGSLSPQYVIKRIGEISGPDAIIAAGVGQHQMWASQFINYEKPRTWLNSGGLGTMGYAVPAAMGAKVGAPNQTVWAIDGDGCFQMTNQELVTCALNNIPIKVAVINNESLGMVRQWQTLFYNQRYSNTDLHSKRVPDFKLLAEAMGCVGMRCESKADVDKTIEAAMAINDRPVVVDFNVHRDAMVWPMVAAGTSNDEITVARSMAPVWGFAGTLMAIHTLAVLVENSPGVLARVASLFSRRGYNIDSLAVGPTENPKVSRMTIVLNLEGHALDQVNAQLFKLVNVIGISEMKPAESLQRELLLVKVANTPKGVELSKKFGAKFIEANGVLEVEAVGERAEIEKFLTELKAVGIKELVQSGVVAMEKGATTLADRTLTTMGTANQSNQDNSTADYQN